MLLQDVSLEAFERSHVFLGAWKTEPHRVDAQVRDAAHRAPCGPSLVGHQLLGPGEPHDLELFLDPLAAILEVLAERLELDRGEESARLCFYVL